MEVLKAIHQRRAVRHYTDAEVTAAVVQDLLLAAVQAPSALNLQPWAFVVLHGRERLARCSARAKAHLLTTAHPFFSLDPDIDEYDSDRANIFHDADTLIVICAKPERFMPAEDCMLAAQNLMLAAHGMGLGTCPVGFARAWFNLPEVKAELGIPEHHTAVLPVVVGHPVSPPPPPPRLPPEILCWHWDG